jgi:undecaprenyl-diphosphatase
MQAWDQNASLLLNGLAGRTGWLEALGIFYAVPLIYVMAALGIMRAAWLVHRLDPIAALAVAGVPRAVFAAAAAFLGNQVFAAYIWFRARPYVDLTGIERLIGEPGTPQSFPSGHASVAFAIAFTSLYVDPACGRWMLAGATLVALGRVFVGVHYPADVLAGAIVGLAWAVAARAAGRRLGDEARVRRLFGLTPIQSAKT